jgi:hypothetical protein
VLTDRYWTAQVLEFSLIDGLTVFNGHTFACGGVSYGFCLQFENPTGLLSAVIRLPWHRGIDVAAVDVSDVVVLGVLSGGSQQHIVARLQRGSNSENLTWGFTTLASQSQFKAACVNEETQQVIVVGYDVRRNAIAASMNKDNGNLVWGYTYDVVGLDAYLVDVESVPHEGLVYGRLRDRFCARLHYIHACDVD